MSEDISYFGWTKQKIADKSSDILLLPQKTPKNRRFLGETINNQLNINNDKVLDSILTDGI
jgi:hypothetical protein